MVQAKEQSIIPIHWAGKNWLLDKRRVIINTEDQLLILSDIHIGYYSSFRANGSYLPTYDAELLQQTIASLLTDYKNYHWIIAGDIKHNHRKILSEDEQRELYNILSTITNHSKLTILMGNHDKGLEELLRDLHIDCAIQESIKLENYTITHSLDILDGSIAGNYILGHVHPILSIDSIKSLFIPIFAVSDNILLLPAFNYVAGGFNIKKLLKTNSMRKEFTIYAIRNKLYSLGSLKEIPE